MKTKPIQRGLSLVSALAMILTTFAVPAFAASRARATAALAVDDRLVLAGEGRNLGQGGNPFDVVVRNTGSGGLPILGGGGPAINYIEILVPEWHTTVGDVRVEPAGWTTDIDRANNSIIVKGGSLAPQRSLTVSFGGTVTDQLADDDRGSLRVSVSENDGGDYAVAGPAGPGALDIDIDVLNLPLIAATGPDGVHELADGATFAFDATDGTVTAGQDNVELAVDVQNLSTETKSVDVTEIRGIDGYGSSTPAVLAPRGSDGDAAPVVVSGATFGSAGPTVVDAAVADSDGASDRIGSGDPLEVTVERAVSFARRAPIAPDFVGAGERTFTISLDKAGLPATLVDAELVFGGGLLGDGPAVDIEDVVVDRGSQQVELEASVEWDPELHRDGDYDAQLTLSGIDDNGASVELGPIALGPVTFDSLVPFVEDLVLTAPDARVGGGQVATNGSTLSYSGTVLDPVGVGEPRPCADCTVSLELVEGTTVYASFTATPDANGRIAGSFSVDDFGDRREFLVRLAAVAADRAGNGAPAPVTSEPVPVDTLRPAVFRAGTERDGIPPTTWDDGEAGECYGCDAADARVRALLGGENEDDQRIIDVVFDEPITGGTTPLHWFVDSNGRNIGVRSAQLVDERKVRLTLSQDFGRNARGVVTYDPSVSLSGQRIIDRAGLTLEEGVADTIDNIIPVKVGIFTVDGLGRFDAGNGPSYFTNVSTYGTAADGSETKDRNDQVEFVVSSLPAGSTVNLEITDGSTTRQVTHTNPTNSDQQAAFFAVDLHEVFGGTEEEPALTDRQLEVDVFITDSGPKAGPPTPFTLVLDQADPTADSALVDVEANAVIPIANEALRPGRNAATDWLINVTRNARPEKLPVNEVLPGTSADRRELRVDSEAYPFDRFTLVDALYRYRGAPEDRYIDAAGNRLAAGSVFPISGS